MMTSGCASTAGAPISGLDKARSLPEYVMMRQAEDAVRPALVRIHVVSTSYFDGRAQKGESYGSGAIISPDGLVVTNHHVAARATRLFVTMSTREVLPAELVGTDALADIAVIRILPPTPRTFPHAEWGDSANVDVGDKVLAMGSPLALSQSVTLGIISNTEMILPEDMSGGMELDGEDVGSIVRWFGHDATIFPGNSGGPLVDMQGRIIGVNEIGYGLAGAIPSRVARPVAEQLIKHGEVLRAHMGATFQPMMKSDVDRKGALVSSVIPESPAAKAGLKPGDVVTGLNGTQVNVRFLEELPLLNLAVAELPIGQAARLSILRDGKPQELEVTPVKRERVVTDEAELAPWGITARNLSIWTKLDLHRDSREGVLVTSMSDGGPVGTAKPPLRGSDVIIAVNSKPVRDLAALQAATADITKDAKEPVPTLVEFERNGRRYVTVVNVGISNVRDPSVEARRAWMPVETQVITREIAKALGNESLKGVRVTQVFGRKDNPDAPLKVGDIITAIDGDPVSASQEHDSEVFEEMVRQYKPDTEVKFSVLRAGAKVDVPIKLMRRPLAVREMRQYRDLDFDFTVREVTYLDRQSPQWQAGSDAEVIVDSVQRGGWTALARLSVGDKLLEVNGTPVKGIDDVKRLFEDIKKRRPDFVIMQVQRGPHTRFIEIETVWPKEKSS